MLETPVDGHYSSWSNWENCTELGVCVRRGSCEAARYLWAERSEQSHCLLIIARYGGKPCSEVGPDQEEADCPSQYYKMSFVWSFCNLLPPAGVSHKGCYRIDEVSFSDRSFTEFDIPPCMCVTHCKMNYPTKLFAGSYNEWVPITISWWSLTEGRL